MPATPEVLLIDNGSSRPAATLALRDLAQALGERTGVGIHPVSLRHADRAPAAALDGRSADTLEPWLRQALATGRRDFLGVPLWFGPSRALSHVIPAVTAALEDEFGPFRLRLTRELCPLPGGEPRLTRILCDHIQSTAATRGISPRRLVLVDHGSPQPAVTAVRTWLAARLREHLGCGTVLEEAAMERRAGPDYDFNGHLLESVLHRLAAADPRRPVILPLLFLAPGRHAGADGDLAASCARVEAAVPGFRVHPTPLVGAHPGLIAILADRLGEVHQSLNGRRARLALE